jgi:hypothetical protein
MSNLCTSFKVGNCFNSECDKIHSYCYYFNESKCEKVDCPFAHRKSLITMKTPCPFFLEGRCTFGLNCQRGHPMIKKEENAIFSQPIVVLRLSKDYFSQDGYNLYEKNGHCENTSYFPYDYDMMILESRVEERKKMIKLLQLYNKEETHYNILKFLDLHFSFNTVVSGKTEAEEKIKDSS